MWIRDSSSPGDSGRRGLQVRSPDAQICSNDCHTISQEHTVTLVALLKACAKTKDLHKGSRKHAHIAETGLLRTNVYVGNTLVNMYAKCGALLKAQQVLDELPVRNVVSWNALITGYVLHGHGKEAIDCFERMQLEGLSPDGATFVWILKACHSIGDLDKGQAIHSEIVRRGFLKTDISVGNALVDMYAKCGALAKAQEVFDELGAWNAVSWNILIAGYTQYGLGELAIECFERMQLENLSPSRFTFACVLKACGSTGTVDKGQEIHDEIVRQELLENDSILGNALVDMYAKCGALAKAQEVLYELPARDAVSWTALISGFTQFEHGKEAIHCFEQMQLEGLCPTVVTFTCILKACGIMRALDKGQKIHARIAGGGQLDKDNFIGSAVVEMYAKCGALGKAQEEFDELAVRNEVSWNALIAGYAQQGNDREVMNYFERMQFEGLCLNTITFACMLKACGNLEVLDKGQEIHAKVIRWGVLEKDIVIGTALVSMYAKCGALVKAQEVIDMLPVRDVVSWTALITEYAQHGHAEKAINCFRWMQLEGICPDAYTFACILKACGSKGGLGKGQEIHTEIVIQGLLDKVTVVCNALVNMYAKCGALSEALEVCSKLPVSDAISWNALITGYAQHGHDEEAISCYEWMQSKGLSPDAFTFACILKTCGNIGAAHKGREIHAKILRENMLHKDHVVGTALVDMYAKCGSLAKAQEVFDQLPVRDGVLWNALIAGYAQLGKDRVVFESFDKMIGDGRKPNVVTFTILLNMCSHLGLVAKGQMYFETMSKEYGIIPTVEHHACMVDLYGRSCHLDKALIVMKQMPFSANLDMWHSLLTACQKCINVELGRSAFEYAIELDGKDGAAYVCMSNLYAAAGMQEDVDEVEAMRAVVSME